MTAILSKQQHKYIAVKQFEALLAEPKKTREDTKNMKAAQVVRTMIAYNFRQFIAFDIFRRLLGGCLFF